MISKQKHTEQSERRQHKIDAGLLSERFPDVESIVITMSYYQKGSVLVLMKRTVNVFPGSPAYFLMECVKNDCTDGGFDLDSVVTSMVRGHRESGNGELLCHGNNSSGHARIDYSIAIQYSNS